LRGYWSAITKDEFDREDIQRNLDRIFLALCGDYPGAVTVRHSHKLFEELKEIDQENLDSQGPDGVDVTDPRTSYLSAESGYSSDHSINFPRGYESGSEHASDGESLEQKNPNDGIPEYHSSRCSGVTTGESPIAAQDEAQEAVTEGPTVGAPKIE
jgi:hypothetical protein